MHLMDLLRKPGAPVDVRPLARRLERRPDFNGTPVEKDEAGRWFHLDRDGRRWFLDGSGEVA